MACKIIYKGKALPEEEAKIEINNDVVDDLNEQAVGKSIINSALLTDEEINQQITDLNKFKTVIENNYFKLEDNISVSSLVINKHIKNAPASLGKVKIDSKWRTKEEAKKQVEENLKQRKLFSKLKRNFGITEEQLNLIENVSADKAISSAEDLINAIESKLLSLTSLVLNSKKSKSATLQQKEQAKTIEQLFNENPELANQVYEALGFNNDRTLDVRNNIVKAYKEKTTINLKTSLLQDLLEFDRNVEETFYTDKEETGRKNIDKLKNSIKEKGLKEPLELSINSQGAVVLSEGNHRFQALKELGYTEIPVIVKGRGSKDEYFTQIRKGQKVTLGLNLNKDFNNQITPQQKQQATFMFSEFLDVYLQDFEQVEKILKEEKIIEKDCTGGGKLKAEKGLQTNFTKGGKWKVYEIFEGKSHKQGGIDINIKNNQISFTNKNGSIKAKYGLVISKDS